MSVSSPSPPALLPSTQVCFATHTHGMGLSTKVYAVLVWVVGLMFLAYVTMIYKQATLVTALVVCSFDFLLMGLYFAWWVLVIRFTILMADTYIVKRRPGLLMWSPPELREQYRGGMWGRVWDGLSVLSAIIFVYSFVQRLFQLGVSAYPLQRYTNTLVDYHMTNMASLPKIILPTTQTSS